MATSDQDAQREAKQVAKLGKRLATHEDREMAEERPGKRAARKRTTSRGKRR